MADQAQQPAQPTPQAQPQQPATPQQPTQVAAPQQIQQSPQSQQQQQQQLQQQIQQQPRVSSVGTVSIQGMVAPQAPTPQPSLAAATNSIRSPSTPIPQLQVIGQSMHGQSYLPQFQGYAQPFMLQNANALAMQMSQMNQLNLAMQQQQQQQQQQNRAANGTNPGSPGGILSPTAASQMPTHMSLGNGNNLISSSMPGMVPQAAVANSNNKGQGNGNKTQAVQAQGQNATAAIASMVAKQPTVLPAQQTAAPPVVLGQIGVFSSQANANLGSNFVPQCTVSTHQGGLRLNQAQMVNNASQIITSQPMQNLLTNQAFMQAMASLQMQQQGIPLAAAATGHQQIINQGQSQMPTIFTGQNFLIRAQGPMPPQPITMTSMQAAAFAGMKTPQQQQQQTQQQQAGKQTNVSGKVMLPSASRTPMTAKIQPSISQPAKVSMPAIPKTTKSRPKTQAKAATGSTAVIPCSAAGGKAAVTVATFTTPTTSTTAVVVSLPAAPVAVVSIAAATPIQATESEAAPPASSRMTLPAVHDITTQSAQPKSQSDSEVETAKILTTPTTLATVDPTFKARLVATAVSTSTPTTSIITAAATGVKTSSSASSASTSPVKLSPIIPGEKLTIDDIVMEEKPNISQVMKSGNNNMHAAMEAAGLMTLVKETKPITVVGPSPIAPQPPVVEKQRAIVKPQILTHIIEGFVIQEGPEPFPVQQSSLLQEFIPPKASMQIVKESEEEGTSYDDEPPTLLSQVDAHLSSTQLLSHLPQDQEKKDQQKQQKSTVKLLKCELCQKVAPASTFNNSRRFCSLSCSRRHNVSHTRRVGLFKPRGTARKRKHVIGRKNWRVNKGGRLTYAKANNNDNSNDENNEDSNTALLVIVVVIIGVGVGGAGVLYHKHSTQTGLKEPEVTCFKQPVGDEMSSSNSAQDTSSSAASPPRSQDFEMDVDANIPRTDPGKWTVTEVYEFIQSMPGCREYAEEFRSQEIDGQALLLLKEDHLMTAMNIKLGPALKICSKINSLKSDTTPA